MSKQKQLLIVSDAISGKSGLGRIARDLATRIHANLGEEIRVGTAGYGGAGSSRFPWPDYHFHSIENWILPELPTIAEDFAGDEELTILMIWDASRLGWFAHPDWCPIQGLSTWLKKANIKKEIYGAIDAEGPNGKLSIKLDYIYKGFDRVLNYSKFSADVTGYPDYISHGIDTSVFKPYNKADCKKEFKEVGFRGLEHDSFLIGIVATNQNRKDWALGFQTAKLLLDRGLDVKMWCHTDVIERYWDIGALVSDFGMQERVTITTAAFNDEQMAHFYSACDVTLGIGNGEGFGYPIFESLACGTPCVHGNYGGAPELMDSDMLVTPAGYRFEGPYCVRRPIYEAYDWEMTVRGVAGCGVALPAELDWNKPELWNRWKEWLLK